MILFIGLAQAQYPDLSELQLAYFAGVALSFGGYLLLVPDILIRAAYAEFSLRESLKTLRRTWHLFRTWLRLVIRVRYYQTLLGIAWIVLLPLAESLVLVFALTQLIGTRNLNVPWVPFLLSGRMMFTVFRQVAMPNSTALVNSGGLINKVYFPREYLLLLHAGQTVIDFTFQFASLMVVCALFGLYPTFYYLYLPLPIIIMLMLGLGTGFYVSWFTLVVRDFHQLFSVIVLMLSYLAILYSRERVPNYLDSLPLVNPVLAVVESFRSIMVYEEQPNLPALLMAAVFAAIFLFVGYIFYKVNEDRISDYV